MKKRYKPKGIDKEKIKVSRKYRLRHKLPLFLSIIFALGGGLGAVDQGIKYFEKYPKSNEKIEGYYGVKESFDKLKYVKSKYDAFNLSEKWKLSGLEKDVSYMDSMVNSLEKEAKIKEYEKQRSKTYVHSLFFMAYLAFGTAGIFYSNGSFRKRREEKLCVKEEKELEKLDKIYGRN